MLKLPEMQKILLDKAGVTFWIEGDEFCSSAWKDNAGGVASIFKRGQPKSIARQNAGKETKRP